MKILVKSLMLMSSLVFFSGCVGGYAPYPKNYHDSTKTTGMVIKSIPQLNTINRIEIGDNMYSKYKMFTHDTFEVELEGIAKGSYFGTPLPLPNNNNSDFNDKKIKTRDGSNFKLVCNHAAWCLIDMGSGKFTHYGAELNSLTGLLDYPVSYKLIPTPDSFNQDSFKYVALYQGKSGNKIKISFREFKDDMARPAFTQDIEYELEKDGTSIIGFKGLRIEVLKATNTDITYKVVKDYN
jgi:hypothetical protein